MTCRIEEWAEPPQMDTGCPMPEVLIRDGKLFVAYLIAHPEAGDFAEEFAVVRFSGVLQHTFGYPNDEALGGHPLYDAGLKFYAFNEVLDSPSLAELGRRNATIFPGTERHYQRFSHWVVPFHDETLEVLARSVESLGVSAAESARGALATHAA